MILIVIFFSKKNYDTLEKNSGSMKLDKKDEKIGPGQQTQKNLTGGEK